MIELICYAICNLHQLIDGIQSNKNQSRYILKLILEIKDCLLTRPIRDDLLEKFYDVLQESTSYLQKFNSSNWKIHAYSFKQDKTTFVEISKKLIEIKRSFQLDSSEGNIESNLEKEQGLDFLELFQQVPNDETHKDCDLIPREDVEFTSSEVYFGTYIGKWCGTEIALKKTKINTSFQLKLDELAILQRLHFPNIINFYGMLEDEGNFYIVTEFTSLGNLCPLIHERTDVELSIGLKIRMLLDISNGMKYLHSQQPIILHRDLKSENILIFSGCQLKITDFGITRNFTDDTRLHIDSSPNLYYRPPEICQSFQEDSNTVKLAEHYSIPYSEQSDVWNFGIVMHEVMYRKKCPVNVERFAMNNYEKSIIDEKIQENQQDSTLIQLMDTCLEFSPNNRPVFSDIRKLLRRYFQQYSSEAISKEAEKLEVRLENINKNFNLDSPSIQANNRAYSKIDTYILPDFSIQQEIKNKHKSIIHSICVSPNGQHLMTASSDKEILVFRNSSYEDFNETKLDEMESSERKEENFFQYEKSLTGHAMDVFSIACAFLDQRNESGLIAVSGSDDKTLKMWNIDNQWCIWTEKKHTACVRGVAISTAREQLLIVSVSDDATIKIWNPKNPEGKCVNTISNAYPKSIKSISFCSINSNHNNSANSDHQRFLTIGNNHKKHALVKLFDTETCSMITTMTQVHEGAAKSIIASGCSNYAISSSTQDRKIKVHDLRSADIARDLLGHQNGVTDLKLLNGKYIVSTSFDKTVKIWDIHETNCFKTLGGTRSSIFSAAVDPLFANWIIVGGENVNNNSVEMKLWSGKLI